MGWLEAVERNCVCPAPNVQGEKFISPVENFIWAIVWGLKRSSNSVIADEHMGTCGEVSMDVVIAGTVCTNWGSYKLTHCLS